MSDPFITTKNIIFMILIFLVWEQLVPDELKSQTAAQFLPEQEVSSLNAIARTFSTIGRTSNYDTSGLNLTFDKSFCIKCNITDCSNLGVKDYAWSLMTKIKCHCFSNNNTCHVNEFDWSFKELKGTIPEEFGNLNYLESL